MTTARPNRSAKVYDHVPFKTATADRITPSLSSLYVGTGAQTRDRAGSTSMLIVISIRSIRPQLTNGTKSEVAIATY